MFWSTYSSPLLPPPPPLQWNHRSRYFVPRYSFTFSLDEVLLPNLAPAPCLQHTAPSWPCVYRHCLPFLTHMSSHFICLSFASSSPTTATTLVLSRSARIIMLTITRTWRRRSSIARATPAPHVSHSSGVLPYHSIMFPGAAGRLAGLPNFHFIYLFGCTCGNIMCVTVSTFSATVRCRRSIVEWRKRADCWYAEQRIANIGSTAERGHWH